MQAWTLVSLQFESLLCDMGIELFVHCLEAETTDELLHEPHPTESGSSFVAHLAFVCTLGLLYLCFCMCWRFSDCALTSLCRFSLYELAYGWANRTPAFFAFCCFLLLFGSLLPFVASLARLQFTRG